MTSMFMSASSLISQSGRGSKPLVCVPILTSRYCNLKLQIHDDEYVMKHAFVQAQGHCAASRMLPFLLQGLLDADFSALGIAWEQFQQLCHGEQLPGGLRQSVAAQIRCVVVAQFAV
jgi:hypothetical protein